MLLQTLTLLSLLVVVTDAFLQLRPSFPSRTRRTTPSSVASPVVLHVAADVLTPQQVKALRKEASRWRARKQLVSHVLPADDEEKDTTGGVIATEGGATLDAIKASLTEHGLVEVRGVSRGDRKGVFERVERIAYELGRMMQGTSPSSR